MRGSTKAVHLTSSMKCPDLLAVSLNDTKPVYLLSMMATGVRLIKKEWGVWSTKVQKKAMINYLCLNVIEEYNKTSEEQNFDLAKLIFIRVWYVYADQINLI